MARSVAMSPSPGGDFSVMGALGLTSIGVAVGSREVTDPKQRAAIIRGILWSLLASAVTAFVVWMIGRRYAFSGRWVLSWSFVALVGGPTALVLLWLTTDFPTREKCSRCGKMRVVDRDRCEHCGAEAHRPEMDGTEVFA